MADFSHPNWNKNYEPDPEGFDREEAPRFRAGAWDNQIQDLELFFLITLEPSDPIQLGPMLVHYQGFVQSHLETVKAQNGNPTYRPYLDRLITLKKLLSHDPDLQ